MRADESKQPCSANQKLAGIALLPCKGLCWGTSAIIFSANVLTPEKANCIYNHAVYIVEHD